MPHLQANPRQCDSLQPLPSSLTPSCRAEAALLLGPEPADGSSGTLARRVGEARADICGKFQGKMLKMFMEAR